MAITFNDLFGPIIDLIGEDRDAKASVVAASTAKQAYPSIGSAVATQEWQTMRSAGLAALDASIGAYGGVQSANTGTVQGAWPAFGVRYIQDNDTGYDGLTADWGAFARALVSSMEADTESVDDSAPTAGTVVYGADNQGDGTATLAINADTTLAELALAGNVELRCRTAGFSNQNAELWTLSWIGVDPRTGLITNRSSGTSIGARGLRTGVQYFDVAATSYPGVGLSPEPKFQVPQQGGSVHTGLNITVTEPTYTPSETSGDLDSVMTAVSVNLVDGAKSNLTRRNTDPNVKGRCYLRIIKDAPTSGDYSFTWYQDAALVVALTDTIVLTTASGTATQTWKAAATNPEAFLPQKHLTTASNFASATVAAGALTQTTTVVYDSNLPFAVGDMITCPITNSYGGVNSRWFVQEGGFAIPVNSSPTIADPI